MTTYWTLTIVDGMIVRDGPLPTPEAQKAIIRRKRRNNEEVFYLDVRADGTPVVGRVTVRDGEKDLA